MLDWITGLFFRGDAPSPTALKRAEKARADAAKQAARLTEENGRLNRQIEALKDEIRLQDQRLTVLAETVEMQRSFVADWQSIFEANRARQLRGPEARQ